MKIEFIHGGIERLDDVGPLWARLNEYHAAKAGPFRRRVAAFTFEARKAGLLAKAGTAAFYVDLALDVVSGKYVGYCISSVTPEKIGEVESIYIEPEYRKRKIGTQLMHRALSWMEVNGATKKVIGVMAGNEQAWPFYARFGFHPKCTILEQLPPADER